MSHSQESSGMPIEEYNIINIKIHLLEEKKKKKVKLYSQHKKNHGKNI